MSLRVEKEIRNYLHEGSVVPNPEVVQNIVEQSIEFISNATHREHRSIWTIAYDQVRFIGWRTWLLQAAVFCFSFAFAFTFLSVASFNSLIPTLISLISVLVSLSMVPFLYRAKRFAMLEVEGATWLSGRRLMFIRAVVFSICDILCALVIFLTALIKSDVSVMGLFFSAMLPCLAASVGLLNIVQKEDLSIFGTKYILLCLALAIAFVLVFIKTPTLWNNVIQSILAIILLVAYVVQIRQGLRNSEGVIFA